MTVTGNTARIATHESWRVSTATGRVLFAETAKRHVVTMRRVPGLVLHKWVVAGLGPAPTG